MSRIKRRSISAENEVALELVERDDAEALVGVLGHEVDGGVGDRLRLGDIDARPILAGNVHEADAVVGMPLLGRWEDDRVSVVIEVAVGEGDKRTVA